MMNLPASRPSRAVIEPVAPVVDGGAFPAKVALGEPVSVVADVFGEGHDAIGAALRWRFAPIGNRPGLWNEIPMRFLVNDRWTASFAPTELGRHEFQIIAWSDHLETWRHGTERKADAGVDIAVELIGGEALLLGVLERARAATSPTTADVDAVQELLADVRSGAPKLLGDPRWAALSFRYGDREPISRSNMVPVDVDRERARFSAWYEFFPRSTVGNQTGHGTLRQAIDRLDRIADMGFDVVYLPPIHPIGVVNRKGRNNATTAEADDTGSPWGIADHLDVHPELGTLGDVRAFVAACHERDMELAMDVAFQCTPDHPWVTEHPEWFRHRADGTIQYAENPPKKYQDIYPIEFETDDWEALWQALADVFRYWIDEGVRIFRVDNPHTKAFPFWEWCIATIRAEHPDTIFLAEAFTRPRVMERLAKLGYNQSYTYFAWRQQAWELREYFTDLADRTVDYFRPNAWPNTPDILTEQLQHGGRAIFVSRAILAATLSANWGIYGPTFELLEHRAVKPGSEEYLDSEKYQIRRWDLDDPHSLAPLITRLNEIRRANPALQHLRTLRFHDVDSEQLLCFSKIDPNGVGDPILVVVNLDGRDHHAGHVHVDPGAFGLGLGDDDEYDVTDLLGGGRYRWRGWRNYVELTPGRGQAHVFAVRRIEGRGLVSDGLDLSNGRIPDLDVFLHGEGTHRRLYDVLGAQVGDGGTRFAVWAPSAEAVHVIGDHDGWAGEHPLAPNESSGIWSAWVQGAGIGTTYKYRITTPDGFRLDKSDPIGAAHHEAPSIDSVIPSPRSRLERRRVDGGPGRTQRTRRSDVDLRGPPRVVGAHRHRRPAVPELSRTSPRRSRSTARPMASPTSSSSP